eukprot:2497322-Rhodomonas_salina.1
MIIIGSLPNCCVTRTRTRRGGACVLKSSSGRAHGRSPAARQPASASPDSPEPQAEPRSVTVTPSPARTDTVTPDRDSVLDHGPCAPRPNLASRGKGARESLITLTTLYY